MDAKWREEYILRFFAFDATVVRIDFLEKVDAEINFSSIKFSSRCYLRKFNMYNMKIITTNC